MYQNQLKQLLHQFHRQTNGQYMLSKLFNDADYRNRALLQQELHGGADDRKLVRKIQAFEDILHYAFRVDYLPETNKQTTKSWRLALFAIVCLSFAVSALAIVDDIKSNRQEVNISQAE